MLLDLQVHLQIRPAVAAAAAALSVKAAATALALAAATREHSHLRDGGLFEHPRKRLDTHIHHIAARYTQSSPRRLLQQQRRPPRHIVLVISQLLLRDVEHRSVDTQFSVFVSSQLERSLLQRSFAAERSLRSVLRHDQIFTP